MHICVVNFVTYGRCPMPLSADDYCFLDFPFLLDPTVSLLTINIKIEAEIQKDILSLVKGPYPPH